ncbi:DUF2282 domain-containing protein [Beijerinckia indica]|uniref:Uncharacterized protein n=1 Tax=Beijerinckia indica subsp. indica (strain ATCC 9039 / DSM 1715 / NCIMB 8712) TaxID=395963 RepID=B2IC96_BEII9|nr:DUF2282 domain-containing protein [Beijerinckia indica]ACB96693.1 conserved hypothetical protein [Beijerinckia indica subsp. indica ATCC 9039]
MDHRTMTLAGSLATALALLTIPAAHAADKEKCYGIALKGQNDCSSGAHACAGQSSVDYDKASFKEVPKGTCQSIKGSLKPGKA